MNDKKWESVASWWNENNYTGNIRLTSWYPVIALNTNESENFRNFRFLLEINSLFCHFKVWYHDMDQNVMFILDFNLNVYSQSKPS